MSNGVTWEFDLNLIVFPHSETLYLLHLVPLWCATCTELLSIERQYADNRRKDALKSGIWFVIWKKSPYRFSIITDGDMFTTRTLLYTKVARTFFGCRRSVWMPITASIVLAMKLNLLSSFRKTVWISCTDLFTHKLSICFFNSWRSRWLSYVAALWSSHPFQSLYFLYVLPKMRFVRKINYVFVYAYQSLLSLRWNGTAFTRLYASIPKLSLKI